MPEKPLLRAVLKSVGLLEEEHRAARSARRPVTHRRGSRERSRTRRDPRGKGGKGLKPSTSPRPREPGHATPRSKERDTETRARHDKKNHPTQGEEEPLLERVSRKMLDFAMKRYLGVDKDKAGEGSRGGAREVNGVNVEKLVELAEEVAHAIRHRDEEGAKSEAESGETEMERSYDRHRKEKERTIPSAEPRITTEEAGARRFGALERDLEGVKELLLKMNLQAPPQTHPDCQFYRHLKANSDALLYSIGRSVGRIREINGDPSTTV
jgi:hypothetical protein